MTRAYAIVLAMTVSGCYLVHERDAGPDAAQPDATVHACPSGPPVACRMWRAAGDPVTLSAPITTTQAAMAGRGAGTQCTALVSWTITDEGTRPRAQARLLDWNGQILSDVTAITMDDATATAVTATGTTDFAVLASGSTGCFVQRVDASGATSGMPIPLGVGDCIDLVTTDRGLSSFSRGGRSGAAPAFIEISDDGSLREIVLGAAPSGDLWSRLVLDDGSSLVYAFSEDAATATYTNFFRHVDANGAPLADQVELDVNGVPIQLVRTLGRPLAVWETAQPGGLPLQAMALDVDGHGDGTPHTFDATGALYGVAVTSHETAPSALVVWTSLDSGGSPAWSLVAESRSEPGTPLGGPAIVLAGDDEPNHVSVLLDTTAQHALVIFDDTQRVRALPLACADHF